MDKRDHVGGQVGRVGLEGGWLVKDEVPDDEVLTFATEQGRAVLTLNRLDFFRLHRSTGSQHGGIIACTRDDADPEALAQRIHAAITTGSDLAGQLIRVVRPS